MSALVFLKAVAIFEMFPQIAVHWRSISVLLGWIWVIRNQEVGAWAVMTCINWHYSCLQLSIQYSLQFWHIDAALLISDASDHSQSSSQFRQQALVRSQETNKVQLGPLLLLARRAQCLHSICQNLKTCLLVTCISQTPSFLDRELECFFAVIFMS